jgi:signal transduction histidine kinase
VLAHGGTIEAESTVSEGTVITTRLPLGKHRARRDAGTKAEE